MDWLVMIFSLYSYYLIGNKNKYGFIVGLVGCLIGIVFFFTTSMSMTIMYVAFSILNILGYIKWSKKLNDDRASS